MNALYECSVYHCRLKPKRRPFTYRVFMFSVDVDELPHLDRKLFGFSHNRFNLFSIDDKDHINVGASGGIRENLITWMAGQGISCPVDARIRLVTFPKVLGYGFNPVSFYYVESSEGVAITAVAEVVNTFREMKLYAVDSMLPEFSWHRRMAKNFYVSPFSDPGDDFDFKLGLPADSWQVNIDDYNGTDRILVSSIRGECRGLTSFRLFWYALKYPLLSLKIIGLIHWHALLLWIQKVPFFRKSERIEVQLEVMRPHSSLKKEIP